MNRESKLNYCICCRDEKKFIFSQSMQANLCETCKSSYFEDALQEPREKLLRKFSDLGDKVQDEFSEALELFKNKHNGFEYVLESLNLAYASLDNMILTGYAIRNEMKKNQK